MSDLGSKQVAEPRKRFFIDTEFIESGPSRPIELLSIGIVCEDGREFYAVDDNAVLANANAWVQENVLPHLGQPRMNRVMLRRGVIDFIGDCTPEFWGYYADYDWIVFCQIFGTMIDLPKGWPMYCRDLKQLCDELGNPQLPKQASTEHNALNDARWNKLAYDFLEGLSSGKEGTQPDEKRVHCDDCCWYECAGLTGGCGCKCHTLGVAAPASPSAQTRTDSTLDQAAELFAIEICTVITCGTDGEVIIPKEIKHAIARRFKNKIMEQRILDAIFDPLPSPPGSSAVEAPPVSIILGTCSNGSWHFGFRPDLPHPKTVECVNWVASPPASTTKEK